MSDQHPDTGRAIELEVEISATTEKVWQALTEAARLASWFPLEARTGTGKGEKVFVSWGDDCAWETTIDVWEPGSHLRWLDDPWEKSDGTVVQLAVDYRIESRHGKTVLRLVNSGFGTGADWDDMYDGTQNGWIYFLRNLKHYLERHARDIRQMAWARFRTQGTPAEAWLAIVGDAGLEMSVDIGSLAAGQQTKMRLTKDLVYEAIIEIANVPATFAALVPELNDALLFIEMEAGGPTCGIWLSTYGVDSDAVDRVSSYLRGIAVRLFPDDDDAAPQ